MNRSQTLRFCLIFAVVCVTCWVSRHFAGEDALIYARYVRNALGGYGMVFNAGERVNALTSPFFAVLLLGASWLLHGHVIFAEFLVYGICLIAACILIEQFVPWSGVLAASTAFFYYCMGMETSLFLMMLSLLLLLYMKGHLNWLPLVALLTVLSRFEGLALAAIIGFHLYRERLRPALWSYLPALGAILAYLCFNHAAYGKWLPSSAIAKMEQGFSGYWGRWPTAFLDVRYLKSMFLPSIYVVPAGLVLGALGLWKERWSRMNRALVPFLCVLGAFYILFNLPHYHWYYAPFFFFAAMYAVRGLPSTRLAFICLIFTVCESFASSIYLLRNATAPEPYIAMGTWIRKNTKPDATIAAVEIGTLGWYDDRYTDDIIGLTNPANARRLMQQDLTSWLPEQRPDYVVVHVNPIFGESAAASSSAYAYVPVHFGPVYLMKRIDSTR